jgi:hypothetical protein
MGEISSDEFYAQEHLEDVIEEKHKGLSSIDSLQPGNAAQAKRDRMQWMAEYNENLDVHYERRKKELHD